MKILIADKFEQAGIEALTAAGAQVAYEPGATAETLPGLLDAADPRVLIVRSTKVPAAVIEAARSLRGIIRAGAGVDNIDVGAASARRIAVCNCPGMNAAAVAELTMAHLLCCDRRLPEQTAALRAGRWDKKEFSRARGLKGTTLGIVGLGAIGKAVARRALAFEMNVVGWSHHFTPEDAARLGLRYAGHAREELLGMVGECDAVSIHVAATPETGRLCDAEFFAAMRPGAYFINTSRGSVVDEAALRDAVISKGLRAGLDVYENQPATPQAQWSTPTAGLPDCSFTHHIGASTDQAQAAVADETVRIVRAYMAAGRFENVVNAGEIS